jgi:hypothetical protein
MGVAVSCLSSCRSIIWSLISGLFQPYGVVEFLWYRPQCYLMHRSLKPVWQSRSPTQQLRSLAWAHRNLGPPQSFGEGGRWVGGGPHAPTPNKTPDLRPLNMWHSSRFHKPVLSFEVHKLVPSFVVPKLPCCLDILKWASLAVLPPYHLAYNYHPQFMAAISWA